MSSFARHALKAATLLSVFLSCVSALAQDCDPGFSRAIHVRTCDGTFRAEIQCDELDNAQFWYPSKQDRPNIPPRTAIEIAQEALVAGGYMSADAEVDAVSLVPCGRDRGFVYQVQFLSVTPCGFDPESTFRHAGAFVLMDGAVIGPKRHVEGDIEEGPSDE